MLVGVDGVVGVRRESLQPVKKMWLSGDRQLTDRLTALLSCCISVCWVYKQNSLFVSGPSLYRLVYVGNLPDDITAAALREHFPEALQVIMPCDEETSERLG